MSRPSTKSRAPLRDSTMRRARAKPRVARCASASSSSAVSRDIVAGSKTEGAALGAIAGVEAQPCEEFAVGFDVGIAGGQKLLAVEDRIRARKITKRLDPVA